MITNFEFIDSKGTRMSESTKLFQEQIERDVYYAKRIISDIDNGLLDKLPKFYVKALRRRMVNGLRNTNLIYNISNEN